MHLLHPVARVEESSIPHAENQSLVAGPPALNRNGHQNRLRLPSRQCIKGCYQPINNRLHFAFLRADRHMC